MARSAWRVCRKPACGRLVRNGYWCTKHQAEVDATRRQQDAETRPPARERGYTTAWDRASKAFIAKHPLCAYCALIDRTTATEVTDHLYPHRRDWKLFWASLFWVPSCRDCHDRWKQSLEHKGERAIDDIARRLGKPTLAEWRALVEMKGERA